MENEQSNFQKRHCTYIHTWPITRDKGTSPEQAMRIIQDDPCAVFPFPIRGMEKEPAEVSITDGMHCRLYPMLFRPDPVVVEEVTPTAFTFRALPGHFRGEGATITFSTFRNEHGTLCLRQQAEFEKNWRHIMFDIGSIVLWSLQAARLIYQIRKYKGE